MIAAQFPDLVYVTQQDGEEQLTRLHADGSAESIPLTLPVSTVNRLSVHPDGQQLLLDSAIPDTDDGNERWQILHHDLNQEATSVLKTGDLSYAMPVWIDEGGGVLYVEVHGVGDTPLMRMKADGSDAHPLLSINSHAAVLSLLCPVLSKDGSTVFAMGFMRHRGTLPECLLYTAQVANGDLVPIGSRSISGFFDLSPDGTTIARIDKGEIMLLNVQSFEVQRIPLSPTLVEAVTNAVVWSDDGRFLAASYGNTLYIIAMPEQRVVHRQTGLARQSAFTWMPSRS